MGELPTFTPEMRARARMSAQRRYAADAAIIATFPPISATYNEYWGALATARGVRLPPNAPITTARMKRFLRAAGIALDDYYRSMGEPYGKGGLLEWSRLNPRRGMRHWAGMVLESIRA